MLNATFDSNVPWWLIATARTRWGLSNFIETGSSTGGTASIASSAFKTVCTIELDPERYRQADRKSVV